MRIKRATNVTVDAALLDEAKRLRVDLSQVLEESLRERIAQARQAKWLKENADAIEEYNAHIERHGMFSDKLRRF